MVIPQRLTRNTESRELYCSLNGHVKPAGNNQQPAVTAKTFPEKSQKKSAIRRGSRKIHTKGGGWRRQNSERRKNYNVQTACTIAKDFVHCKNFFVQRTFISLWLHYFSK
jgi:hypothetical protein